MKVYKKAKDDKKPTKAKPKGTAKRRKPVQPLNETEKQVSNHVVGSIVTLKAVVDSKVIQDALASAHINTSTDRFPWQVFGERLSEVADPLAEITRRSIATPHLMPKSVALQTRFNHHDPRVIASAKSQASKLATSMTSEQYAKVRTIIGNGVEKGDTVKQISRALRNHIGLNARQDRQMSSAVIEATRKAVDAGLEGDLLDAAVQDVADSLYTRLINYRADMIARTETMKAQNAGFMIGVEQSVEDPKSSIDNTWLKRWIATDDERTCETCGALDGTEVPIDEDFETDAGDTIPYPLADGSTPHPNCRCTVGVVPPGRNISDIVSGDEAAQAIDAIDEEMAIEASLNPSQEIIDLALAMFRKEFNPDQPRDDHGRWTDGGGSSETGQTSNAVGGAGKDITEHMNKVFADPNIQAITEKMKADQEAAGKAYGDASLTLIAQAQGFDGQPKTVDTFKELQDMVRTVQYDKEGNYVSGGGRIVYRGLSDYAPAGDGKVTLTGAQGAQEFMNGQYYSGWGFFGNGTYTASNLQSASEYAHTNDGENHMGNGVVIAMAIPRDAVMPTEDVVKEIIRNNETSMVPSVQGDVGRILAAKGYQAYDAGMVQPDKTGIIVVLDRSMLTVSKETL